MEFLNKIANAVVSNPLIKDFEMLDVVTQAGPWVIHNAIKRSTRERVSVFVLSKKMFDKLNKHNKEYVLEKYRSGVKMLTKVRHPKFLTIQHPLEESRDSLAFATEPCTNSLSNLIKCGSATDVEIRYGILQLLDGVVFLHSELKRCHNNLCLDSVVLNNQGLWKIFGFEFSTVSGESSEPPPPEFLFYDNEPHFSQVNLGYVAPELLSARFGDTSADMYSLGCLIYALFNRGVTLRHAEDSRTALRRSDEIAQMPITSLGSVPPEAANDVKQLLSLGPSARQQVELLQQANFLSDIGAVSLQFLDHLMLKNRNQKISFFKELPSILPRLPLIVRKKRILTQLFECCKEIDLTAFILPSVFHIGTDLNKLEFQEFISPGLKPLFSIADPPHIPLIIIQNLHLIISKSNMEDAKTFVLPVLFRSLETSMVELQESVLKLLPDIVDLMDYSTLRHQLLPKIKGCCLETRLLKIRVGSLLCVAKVLDSSLVDKSLTVDILLPLLEQVPSREPAVLMSIVGIYQKLLKHKSNLLDKDTLATRCIPILFPLLISPSLNVKQFNTCMVVVKDMMTKVETEQLTKLKQMDRNKAEQEQSLSFSKEVVENKQVGELVIKMDQMFGGTPNVLTVRKQSTEKPQTLSPMMASSTPASIPRMTNYDQLAPAVSRSSNPPATPSNSASTFDANMFKMVSENSKPKSSPSPQFQYPAFGVTNNTPTATITQTQFTMGNNPSFHNSQAGSVRNGMGNIGSGNSTSYNHSFGMGNSTMSMGNIGSMAMPSNSPQFGQGSFGINNYGQGNLSMGNTYSGLSNPSNYGMMSNNPSNIVGTNTSSLDNLFGAPPTKPSLQQMQMTNNQTLKPMGGNPAPAKNQAAIDLNDIFG